MASVENDFGGENPKRFYRACEDGDIIKVKTLFDEENSLLNIKDINRMTPLMTSVTHCQNDVSEFLLSKPEIVLNAFDSDQYSVLHCCSIYGAPVSLVKKILQSPTGKEADFVNARDNNGYTALELAVMENKPELVTLLASHSNVKWNQERITGIARWVLTTFSVAYFIEIESLIS